MTFQCIAVNHSSSNIHVNYSKYRPTKMIIVVQTGVLYSWVSLNVFLTSEIFKKAWELSLCNCVNIVLKPSYFLTLNFSAFYKIWLCYTLSSYIISLIKTSEDDTLKNLLRKIAEFCLKVSDQKYSFYNSLFLSV